MLLLPHGPHGDFIASSSPPLRRPPPRLFPAWRMRTYMVGSFGTLGGRMTHVAQGGEKARLSGLGQGLGV